MKVLIISNLFPPRIIGGAEVAACARASAPRPKQSTTASVWSTPRIAVFSYDDFIKNHTN